MSRTSRITLTLPRTISWFLAQLARLWLFAGLSQVWRSRLPLIVLLAAWLGNAAVGLDAALAKPAVVPPETTREILVPYDELELILEHQARRIFVPRAEYEDLIAQAKTAPERHPPRNGSVVSAEYDATIERGRATIRGTLQIEILADGLHAIPLPVSGASIRRAALDNEPASLGKSSRGEIALFVQGRGRHVLTLDLLTRLVTSSARQSLRFELPAASASAMRLTAPGNVEVKSGAGVIRREVDKSAGVTRFELLITRGETNLELSLNNRLLREDRVVLARSVVIDELTAAYERLHVTASMDVLHGATDRFRFVVPDQFEITSVETPELSSWVVEQDNDQPGEGSRVLEVLLRQPTTEVVVLSISATRSPSALAEWTMPQLIPLDTAGQVAVLGLLLEDRYRLQAIASEGLIPIDVDLLRATLPASVFEADPGAPVVRSVAAFYAPYENYALQGQFDKPTASIEATSNLLLELTDARQLLRGAFVLRGEGVRIFAADIFVPAGWEVTRVTDKQDQPLSFETYDASEESAAADAGADVADEPSGNAARIHVTFPRGVSPGESYGIYVQAVRTPTSWLQSWKFQEVEFPMFRVVDARGDAGALAVAAADDLAVRVEQVTGLSPLDDNQKQEYGMADVEADLAFRFEQEAPSALFRVERTAPRITARTFSFLKFDREQLVARYEIAYEVDRARTPELSFLLPESTPREISLRGLDGVVVKESASRMIDGQRRWTAQLADRARGPLRLAVDLQYALDEVEGEVVSLPVVRAADVAYQSGIVAVEGSSELDVQLIEHPRRVDVGELVDAQYQPGRRLLGAFEFIGDAPVVRARATRHPSYELPSAIIQRAELATLVSANGIAQTAARFLLRTRASLLEVQLPTGAELWTIYLDGQPSQPQREAGRLLLNLPPGDALVRNLQIVYEAPIDSLKLWGRVTTAAPQLMLRKPDGDLGEPLPLADLVWELHLPKGYSLARNEGTVFTDDVHGPTLPVTRVAESLLQLPRMTSLSQAPTSSDDKSELALLQSTTSEIDRLRDLRAATPTPGEGTSQQLQIDRGRDAARFGRTLAGEVEDYAARQSGLTDELLGGDPDRNRSEELAKAVAANSPSRDAGSPGVQRVPTGEFEEYDDDLQATLGGQLDGLRRRSQLWALEGIRSLQIELQTASGDGQSIRFASLGIDPAIDVTLVDNRRMNTLAWGIALLVLLIGLALMRQPGSAWLKFSLAVILLTTLVPLITGWNAEFGNTLTAACAAALLLVPFFVLLTVVTWSGRICSRLVSRLRSGRRLVTSGATTAALVAVGWLPGAASAAPQANDSFAVAQAESMPIVVQIAPPEQPVNVPPDAVIIPYDPDVPVEDQNASRLLVPYDRYIELWNLAYPEQQVGDRPAPAPFGLADAQFETSLSIDDFLVIAGHVDVNVYADGVVAVPLPLKGAVLTKATLDGSPARIQFIESRPRRGNASARPAASQKASLPARPASPLATLLVSGKGRHRLELAVRFPLERQGGWRVAQGRVPTTPATQLTLIVPQSRTEVRLGGVLDRAAFETTVNNERFETALTDGQALRIAWRPKIHEAAIDQSLTAESAALVDVQEDGLRVTWQLELSHRGGERDSFTIQSPADYLVENVEGDNVRGWQLAGEGHSRTIEVKLLKPSRDRQRLVVRLSKRGSVGAGEFASFSTPVISVAEAALHRGHLAIRRSPLIELRTGQTVGVARADQDESTAPLKALVKSASPLGIRDYQAYRFAATPFEVSLSAAAAEAKITARLQSVVRVADQSRQLEAQIKLHIEGRPVHRLRLAIPDDLTLDNVSSPQWSLVEDQDRRVVTVHLTSGAIGDFVLRIRGALGDRGPVDSMELPQLKVLDVESQEGDIVIQADPALDIRAVELTECESILMARVHAWLAADQRPFARLAIHHRSADYGGRLLLGVRTPRVSCMTVTNVLVNDKALEETIYLAYAIRDAGVRSVEFRLPSSMRDARVTAPLLRQKTIEPVGDDGAEVRFRLDLQDDVIGEFQLLVTNDRLPPQGVYRAPLPGVETARLTQQFVVVESDGRDEVVIDQHRGLTPLSRQQRDWQRLADLLPGGITRAFLVEPGAVSPELALHTLDRDLVETAGARIELAKTLLVVDANGAYAGRQVYYVDNSTEQFLDVRLPAGATLWTAQVAAAGVKPKIVPGGTPRQVRIPLVKTARGDANFLVILKYGGRIKQLGGMRNVRFPLLHTENVNVELSQVQLRLPESYRWYDFAGSMRRVDHGDQLADEVSYYNKQIRKFSEVYRGDNPFAKLRARNNMTQLGLALENFRVDGRELESNERLQRELSQNTRAWEEVQQEVAQDQEEEAIVCNRDLLAFRCASQSVDRSKNIVSGFDSNFAEVEARTRQEPRTPHPGDDASDQSYFEAEWFARNLLDSRGSDLVASGPRVKFEQEAKRTLGRKWGFQQGGEYGSEFLRQKSAPPLGEPLNMPEEAVADQSVPNGQPATISRRSESREQLRRYKKQLEDRSGVGSDAMPQIASAPVPSARESSDELASGETVVDLESYERQRVRLPESNVLPAAPRRQAGQASSSVQTATPGLLSGTGLVSLDVQLPLRGVEYLFSTPRGKLEITARAVSRPLIDRGRQLLLVATLILVVGWTYFAVHRRRSQRAA